MAASVQTDLGLKSVNNLVGGSLAQARVDTLIPSKLNQIPGLGAAVQEIVAHAAQAGEAISEIAVAVNIGATASAAEGKNSGAVVDANALKAGVAKLTTATAVGPLLDKIEKILNDASVRAALKKAFTDRSSKEGATSSATIRGALKSVTPSTVAVSSAIQRAISAVQSHQKLATQPDAKATLAQAEKDLQKLLGDVGNHVTRLVAIVDGTVAATLT